MPQVGNGLGPWWFPAWGRRFLTRLSARFFREAAWEKHDAGYAKGRPARAVCDRRFLQAMLRDASQTNTTPRIAACCVLAWFYWGAVRIGGRWSYNWRAGGYGCLKK
jgi:hypothetical protein